MYELNIKDITLKDFEKRNYRFKTSYVDEDRIDYEITTNNGIRIYIGQFCGPRPYMISVYSPNGKDGGAAGFYTAQDALEYLKGLNGLNESLEIRLVC